MPCYNQSRQSCYTQTTIMGRSSSLRLVPSFSRSFASYIHVRQAQDRPLWSFNSWKQSTDPLKPPDSKLDIIYSRPASKGPTPINPLQVKDVAYSSPTAYDPSDDYEMPSEPSLLEQMLTSSGKSHLPEKLSPRAHVSVVIDGDNLLFHQRLLEAGYKGGKEAAERVISHALSRLPCEQEGIRADNQKPRVAVRAMVVTNWTDLTRTLENKAGISSYTLEEFKHGWQTNGGPFFTLMDAGRGKQMADVRVRAYLADEMVDQDCLHLYLGGLRDLAYGNELVGLRKLGLLDKISLLQLPPYLTRAKIYQEFVNRVVEWQGVFTDQGSFGLQFTPARARVGRAGEDASSTNTARRRPCVGHHLLGHCERGKSCPQDHSPLSAQALKKLRAAAQREACPSVARGEPCDYGAACPYAH